MRIDKYEITNKLALLRCAIPAKPPVECMKGILVKGGRITAYNLQLAVSSSYDADSDETFIIPPVAIDMIRSLPDCEVRITGEEKGGANYVRIQADGIDNRFLTMSPKDYPEIPGVDGTVDIQANMENLHECLSSILYAAATDNARPTYNGVLFEGDGTHLNLVAIDGYRAAWAKLPYTREFEFIVPRNAVRALLDIGLEGDISINSDNRYAEFSVGDFTVHTRLVDGNFLDYRKVFAVPGDVVEIDRVALMDSVRRAMICGADSGRSLIVMEFKDYGCKVSSRSAMGEYDEEISVSDKCKDGLRIGFNGRYLSECLKSYKSEMVPCRLSMPTSPMVIDDGTIQSLVLPVRLSANR